MNSDIPYIIFGLIVLYIALLMITKEQFHSEQELPKDLIIKPTLLKGHVPISSKSELITKDRENVDKYIKESMLLNKPNLNLGYEPSNVRYMNLMYNKPTEIGPLP